MARSLHSLGGVGAGRGFFLTYHIINEKLKMKSENFTLDKQIQAYDEAWYALRAALKAMFTAVKDANQVIELENTADDDHIEEVVVEEVDDFYVNLKNIHSNDVQQLDLALFDICPVFRNANTGRYILQYTKF